MPSTNALYTAAMFRLTVLSCIILLAACTSPEKDDKPYVILISIDGLGADARDRAVTPALDFLAENGLVAERMLPVFPTQTFPNHYSIATGLYPAEHGIVANVFPNQARDDWYALHDRDKVQDGDWYQGVPLWAVAENNGMKSASYYFVGSEADIGGIRPSIYYDYDASVPGPDRVDEVLRWLSLPAGERPQMMTLYFEDVDTASHVYGVTAEETLATIARVDAYVGRLVDGIQKTPVADRVTVVIVSDHGLADTVSNSEPFLVDQLVDLGDAKVVEGGSYLNVFDATLGDEAEDRLCEIIDAAWDTGRCYTRRSAPSTWRITNDGRFPDLILAPETGYKVASSADASAGQSYIGYHGWLPDTTAMAASFIAWGPTVIPDSRIEEMHVIDVYPFILEILGLPAPREIPKSQERLIQYLTEDESSSRRAFP